MQRQRHLPAMHQLVDGAGFIVDEADERCAAGALAHARRRDALFQTGKTADAVLTYSPGRVEVDLFVGTGANAFLCATAAVLVAKHQAIFRSFVHGAVRARFDARGLRAVVAEAWDVKEVGIGVLTPALVFIPVHPPRRWFALGLQERALPFAGGVHLLVIELPGSPDLLFRGDPASYQPAIGIVPAAHLLVVARGAATGLCIHRAPPHMIAAVPLRPQHLAGNGTGLTADAAVQIEDPRDLVLSFVDPSFHVVPSSPWSA